MGSRPCGRFSSTVSCPDSLAAVVVNYEAGESLRTCVESLLSAGVEHVVVVDNASKDGSLETLSGLGGSLEVLALGKNVGYGAAANQGVLRTSAPWVIISNPDVIVSEQAPSLLRQACQGQPRAAIAGPKVMEPSGEVYPSAREFPSLATAAGHVLLGLIAPRNRFTQRYRSLPTGSSACSGPIEVDWVSGSFMLVRREAFLALGGFDEAYFMYAEDVDLCWRAWRAGWRVLYVAQAEVVHVGGASTSKRPYAMILEHHRSAFRFACRSQQGLARALLPVEALVLGARALVALGVAARQGTLGVGARHGSVGVGARHGSVGVAGRHGSSLAKR
jgi:N-acetylglucosaminyl-diphospho-decaprenol L-rhamnosyltransferase